MNTRQLTATDLKATPPVLTEDAIIGIDRALSKYEQCLKYVEYRDAGLNESVRDMYQCLAPRNHG